MGGPSPHLHSVSPGWEPSEGCLCTVPCLFMGMWALPYGDTLCPTWPKGWSCTLAAVPIPCGVGERVVATA